MNPWYEESEFIFCDLQAAARYARGNPVAAEAFLEAAYETFEFLAQHPGAGRPRGDLGVPEVRSWRVRRFRRFLVFHHEQADHVQIWRVLHCARDLQRELSQ